MSAALHLMLAGRAGEILSRQHELVSVRLILRRVHLPVHPIVLRLRSSSHLGWHDAPPSAVMVGGAKPLAPQNENCCGLQPASRDPCATQGSFDCYNGHHREGQKRVSPAGAAA
jgi:hypothetical protein